MTSESPIWKINKKSRIKVGSGMIRRKTIRTTNAVTTLLDKLENFFNLTQIPFILISEKTPIKSAIRLRRIAGVGRLRGFAPVPHADL
jgi:hypothetical protein